MKKYKYDAININKEKFSGTFIAKDEKDLAVQLSKQNLFLVSCAPYKDGTPSAFFTLGTGKVKLSELTTFCRQFAVMITSGLSVLNCLECLKDQKFSKYFISILNVIYEDVKSGIVLSEAIDKHKAVFPEFFRSMIHVGEASGKLDEVFNALADYYENDAAVKRKVKSAMSYPMMLGGMTIVIVILMLAFIVPRFKDTLSDLNVEPNGFTKFIYGLSDFVTTNWLYLLAGIIVVVLIFILIGKTKAGALFYDKMMLKIPLVKKVQIATMTSRFAKSFALMLNSGMDVAAALDAVSIVISNKDARARFVKAVEEVKHGAKIATSFEKYHLFPQIMIQMIAVGERTAQLENVMQRTCSFFEGQVEETLDSVTAKIQPVMLVIMGVVIGGMFIAVYSPMISIMTSI